MDHTEKEELAWRRKAIRLTFKGWRPREILRRIPRGRTWLFTWQQRFAQLGWGGLRSRSRRPATAPHAYDPKARLVVIRLRRSLQQRQVGLIGPQAIQREIEKHRLLNPIPALATIKRWLKAAGLLKREPAIPATVYYPAPSFTSEDVLQAMDWTARYLEGGEKVFVFHTVDARTRALHQTIGTEKTTESVRQHALEVWQTLGLPHGLQLDNDAAFTGGERTARRFGTFIRLCLYLGIELIFTPPREPKRNWLVEGLNGLWAKSFWNRTRFRSLAEVMRKSPRFTEWYAHDYYPPELQGLTPAEAQRNAPRQRLTKRQIAALPEELPVTAGRIHFIRRVTAAGEISFLGERWAVGRRLAHQYVWAMVTTHCRRLEIYYQRTEDSERRLIKTYDYEIPETVRRLRPEYQR